MMHIVNIANQVLTATSGLFVIAAIVFFFRSRKREISITEELTFMGMYDAQYPIWRILAMSAVVYARISTWEFYWLFLFSIFFRFLSQIHPSPTWYKLALGLEAAAVVAMWA